MSSKDNVKLAVMAIILSVLALSLGDAVIKRISIGFSLWQIYVVRSCIALVLLLFIVLRLGKRVSLIPISIPWALIRSFLLVLMWISYYASLPHIKLSVAAAVYYTTPLFITLISATITKEQVGKRSWLAVVIGFLGVLIIIRPDTSGFNRYTLLPLVAAILYAAAMILTRARCREEDPRVLSLILNISFVVTGTLISLVLLLINLPEVIINQNPFLLGSWVSIDTEGFVALFILAVVVVIGSLFAAMAYQKGPPSVIASFDYSYLVFSALWGFLFFREQADGLTLLGMALIVIAGILSTNFRQTALP